MAVILHSLPDDLRALLALAAAQGEAAGARVWLVGGIIRDLLLGLPPSRDVDLAVEGAVGPLAAGLAAAAGGRVTASHTPFGTATVVAPGPGGPVVLDLARTRVERYARPAALPEVAPAPIEADLSRRDFSVNAIAVELRHEGGEPRTGRLLDPFDGRGDLASGRLRLLHAASLRDDPTRLLRGVRLAARLGLEAEPGSRAQIDAALAAGYLGMLTPERVLGELCLALEEPRPDTALRQADTWGVTPQVAPGLRWDEGLAQRSGRLAAAAGVEERELVWAGVLLYGLGEGELAALAGRYPLPGEAAALLRQLAPLRRLAPALAGDTPNSTVERLLRPFGATAARVLHFAEPRAAPAAARYLGELRAARPPLDGNDLRRLGVEPGPAMGRLLEGLRAAALDGGITTRAEAEAWVLARLDKS